MTAAQRSRITRELEQIRATVERLADELDPKRGPRSALREEDRLVVVALDTIGLKSGNALAIMRNRARRTSS